MSDNDLAILLLILGPAIFGVVAIIIQPAFAFFHIQLLAVERSINGYKAWHARQMNVVEIIAVADLLFVWCVIKLRAKWMRHPRFALHDRAGEQGPGDGDS